MIEQTMRSSYIFCNVQYRRRLREADTLKHSCTCCARTSIVTKFVKVNVHRDIYLVFFSSLSLVSLSLSRERD